MALQTPPTDARRACGPGTTPASPSTASTTPTVARWGPINAFQPTDVGGRRYRHPGPVPRRPRLGAGLGVGGVRPGHAARRPKAAIFEQWLATPERRFAGADTPDRRAGHVARRRPRRRRRRSSPTCWPATPTPPSPSSPAPGWSSAPTTTRTAGSRPPRYLSGDVRARLRGGPHPRRRRRPLRSQRRRAGGGAAGVVAGRGDLGPARRGVDPRLATSTSSSSTSSAPMTG